MSDNVKLRLWQDRLRRNENAYSGELAKMEEREKIYGGTDLLRRLVPGDEKMYTQHVRNMASELIESQADSAIPQPKVTPKRPQDAGKATLIEDLIRVELDRLPMEVINDLAERTVPIQGGALFLVEWDNTKQTHTTAGELRVTMLHPRQVIPQDGIYTGTGDMDYMILKIPQTREAIKRKYGIDLCGEAQSDSMDEDYTGDDVVTQYIAYYRNESGGIGQYSWVSDTQLEDAEDCQARRQRRCKKCGEPVPDKDVRECPACGGKKFAEVAEEYEEILFSLLDEYMPAEPGGFSPGGMESGAYRPGINVGMNADMNAGMNAGITEGITEGMNAGMDAGIIGGMNAGMDLGLTQIVMVPSYKPEIFPLVLQKNVSVYGKFLGDSDIDKIKDQQNTANRIEQKIIDKLLKSGSYLVLPEQADIAADAEDMKVIRPETPAAANQIGVKDLQGNISQDLQYLEQVYQEARQITGITESYQGRVDSTATSGKAKEFSAAQAAGRLESKRVMKYAAYADLFEIMFKFALAYMDEPRPVASKDEKGNPEYKTFDRRDFLEQDAAGEWYWNDQFLFSCDTTSTLSSNRDAMWEETRQNFQSGAFGDPAQMETLVMFWKKMEMLQYPGASETRADLEAQALEAQELEAQALEAQTLEA